MTKEDKKSAIRDIKHFKRLIRRKEEGQIAYATSPYGVITCFEIAARYLRIKGYPIQMNYGTSTQTRDCYISIKEKEKSLPIVIWVK